MMKLVVLCGLVAAASASVLAPFSPLLYSSSLIAPYNYNYNYRGPLSLAPGQPANILGADGRPLDTLEVNLDRSAHLISKAVDNGFHILKKRSAAFAPFSPLFYSAPLITPYSSNYRGPLSLAPGQPASILGSDGRPLDTLEVNLDRSAHLISKAVNNGFHILKKRSAPIIAPIIASHVPLVSTRVITPAEPIAPVPVSPIAPYYPVPYSSVW